MNNTRWSEAEVNLLYESYKDGLSLNELIDFLEVEIGIRRTQSSIVRKLSKLTNSDSYHKWFPVASFYGKQFYRENKARFSMWRKRHYANYKKQIESYYQGNLDKERKSQKRYYERKKKPYREIGNLIRHYIELRYGNKEGSIKRFIDDLIDLDVIRDKDIAYHWVNGYRRPNRDSLDKINMILSMNNKDFKTLEILVNHHRRAS